MKKEILIIAGPTGVGKTELSLDLAKALDGEIISADSMQIYKGMDVGTAKILPDEMQGVPHHLLDIVSPSEPFTVYDFLVQSNQAMDEIIRRGKLPIFAGGTGLYINTLLYEMDFNKANIDMAYREELWQFHHDFGTDALFAKLLEVDPDTEIEKENTKRVIRALEIYKERGKVEKFAQMPEREDISATLVILHRDRQELYENINRRVDKMMEQGLLDEVKAFYEQGLDEQYQSMKAIGYLQVIKHFKDEYDYDEMVEKIKQETRRYAKRQITWFKRYKNAHWFNLSEMSKNEVQNEIVALMRKSEAKF